MGLKHKLKRLSKQFKVLSVQTQSSVAGIAQMRRLIEQQSQTMQQQAILLEQLSQKIDYLLEQHATKLAPNQSGEPENNLQTLAEQYTAVTRYQSELVRLQAENISQLLTLIDQSKG